jgi:hypothetical protein
MLLRTKTDPDYFLPCLSTRTFLATSQWLTGGPKKGQFLFSLSLCLWYLFLSPAPPLQSLAYFLMWSSPLSHDAYSLPWCWRQCAPLKCWFTSTRLHGATSQKTCHLHTCCLENLKFHNDKGDFTTLDIIHIIYARKIIIYFILVSSCDWWLII